MDKLVYACPWGNDRVHAWSGTYWGLYNALEKIYDIDDFDVSYSKENLKNPIVSMQHITDAAKNKLGKNDFSIGRTRCFNRIAKTKYKGRHEICVQFSECPDIPELSSYIYQDLNLGHLMNLCETQPEIFAASGFGRNYTKDVIYKREKLQRDFYGRASGIFTMGKWLARELVDVYGLPENKVFHAGGGTTSIPH